MDVVNAFSTSYQQARKKFLEAAATAGLEVDSYIHPLKGRDGEELAMDVVLDGPADAKSMLLVSSACHGVEGYCGSGVQVYALHDEAWRKKAREQGVAVLYVHGLNPHGFSHVRRVTNENVDLNRNFHDFSKPLPANPGYSEIHPLLLPESWPPDAENAAAIGRYVAERGEKAYQQAISGGQHDFADGVFFGGQAPTWSNQTIRKVLRKYGTHCTNFAWIDIHTGLGPSGLGERIFACRDDKPAYARASDWWGNNGETPVTSIYNGSSTSAFLTGLMCGSMYEECPQAECTGIAMEYGTQPVMQVMHSLRADHWLFKHPEASPELAKQIKKDVMEAFYTDTDVWKGQIVSQARQAMFQGVDGLKASLH